MLPVKLVRSLVLGEPITTTNDVASSSENDINHNVVSTHKRTPLLLFLPPKELVTDTYRLATIARDIGFDLHPTPPLSHIIFTHPPPLTSPPPSSPSTASFPSTWSSTSLSPQFTLSQTIPSRSPFPPSSELRRRTSAPSSGSPEASSSSSTRRRSSFPQAESAPTDWDCCSARLYSRLAGDRIGSMEGFSRALTGAGWSLFKTKESASPENGDRRSCGRGRAVYLFRKVDVNRVWAGECRIRELRLPALDFRNAPLRILQYILLMTDNIFYLA